MEANDDKELFYVWRFELDYPAAGVYCFGDDIKISCTGTYAKVSSITPKTKSELRKYVDKLQNLNKEWKERRKECEKSLKEYLKTVEI